MPVIRSMPRSFANSLKAVMEPKAFRMLGTEKTMISMPLNPAPAK